jgi:hypothetical protein
MTIKAAILILEEYNQWRRGDLDKLRFTPKTIGEAIETIVNDYEQK